MTSPLSPEAVAQMVARLRTRGQHQRATWDDGDMEFTAADMLTTLAAENATLRVEFELLTAIKNAHKSRADGHFAELATLRASEAAAQARLRVMADAVGALGDDLTYFPELTKHNLHQRAYDIAISTPATEPPTLIDAEHSRMMRAARPAPQPAADTRVDYAAALSYASSLAETLHDKHYSRNVSWKPLPDLLGLLTQIDNMVAGIIGNATPAPSDKIAEAARKCLVILDGLVAESGRGIDYGFEDAFRMGEWFEDADLAAIEELRALAGPGDTP